MYLHFLSNFIPIFTQSSSSTEIGLIQPKTLKEKQLTSQATAISASNVYQANILNAPTYFVDEQETLNSAYSRTQIVHKKRLHWWM
jgi:hypothetical protein